MNGIDRVRRGRSARAGGASGGGHAGAGNGASADLAGAGSAHGLPDWLLPALLRIELAQVGRFGAGGINVRVAECLERAASGKGAPDGVGGTTGRSPDAEQLAELVALRVERYRQFRTAELAFRREPGRPVTIVEGHNGYGKSHLVEALEFALLDLDNRTALERRLHRYVDGDDRPRLSVEVELDTFEGPVRVLRQAEFRRAKGGFRQKEAADLTVVLPSHEQALQGREAQEWIQARWPKDVLRYFVFDAESAVVEGLSGQDGESLPEVREQVEAALGIRPLRKAAERCRAFAADRKKQLPGGDAGGGADPESLRRRVESAQAELDQVVAELDALDHERTELAGRATAAEDKLSNVDPTAAAEDWDGLERQLRAARDDLERARATALDAVAGTLPLVLVDRALTAGSTNGPWRDARQATGARAALARVADAAAAGRIPWVTPPDRDRALAELEAVAGLSDAPTEPSPLAARAEHAASALPDARVLDLLEGGQARVAVLERRLADRPPDVDRPGWKEAVDEALAARRALADELRAVDETRGRLEERRTLLEGELEEATKARRSSERTATKRARLMAAADVAQRAAGALTALAEKRLQERLDVFERDATQALRDVVHKRDLYDHLTVDRQTLRYRVEDADGRPAPPGRSSGERTVLALALVGGLRRTSGLRFPLFVEAPLKTLDPIHQTRVVNNFLCAFEGQTILLAKPDELPGPDHALRTQVGQRFRIQRVGAPGEDVSEVVDIDGGAGR